MAVKSDQVILVWTEEIIFNMLWSAVDQMSLTIEYSVTTKRHSHEMKKAKDLGVVCFGGWGVFKELLDAGELLGNPKVAVSRATLAQVRDINDDSIEICYLRGVLQVIWPVKLHDAAFPVRLFANDLVDLVIEIAEAVLVETSVLDLNYFSVDLSHDCRPPRAFPMLLLPCVHQNANPVCYDAHAHRRVHLLVNPVCCDALPCPGYPLICCTTSTEFWCTNKEVNILVNEEARLARQTKLSAHEAAWKASWQAFGGYWEKI
ncbi:hypothetical protein JHK87_019458 [Glycine soja]|nr:hypothetical protein JHK87_019458 [Glycine soja]